MKTCDLLLTNGLVFDGTGLARRRVNVAVRSGLICAVGDTSGFSARQTIDLKGLAVAPGFIDVHTHDDRLLLADPSMSPKVKALSVRAR